MFHCLSTEGRDFQSFLISEFFSSNILVLGQFSLKTTKLSDFFYKEAPKLPSSNFCNRQAPYIYQFPCLQMPPKKFQIRTFRPFDFF